MPSMCFIGASTTWVPMLLPDMLDVFKEPLEIRFLDIDPRPAERCTQLGQTTNKATGRKDVYLPFTDRRAALKDADAVIITCAVGGLDAMDNDIAITEKYGIYTPVGVTCGPAGWSCSIRNIPEFIDFARDFTELCPRAFIANYTNPLSALTAVLIKSCPNPVVGLCHAYFETKDIIQKILGLENWRQLAVSIAGMNHYTWIVDFKVDKEDGYRLLRQKVGTGSLRDVLPEQSTDDVGFVSGHNLCVELYDAFGYLPYPADRHTSEFVSYAISGNGGHPNRTVGKNRKGQTVDVILPYNVYRTAVQHRRDHIVVRDQNMKEWIDGTRPLLPRSRETGAEMIRAYLYNQPFVDAVNHLNIGQVAGLTLGACVETLGVVDGLGVRPLTVDRVPESLLEVMRPQANCQKWITQGMLENNKQMLLEALYFDPQCAHLAPGQIRAMADELIEANKPFVKEKGIFK